VGNWRRLDTSTNNLYADLDESSASDSDYIIAPMGSGMPEDATTIKFHLTDTVTDPEVGTDHKVTYRAKTASGGRSLTISLREGTTEIAAETKASGAVESSFTNYTLTLSSSEANSIGTYNDLQIWVTAGSGDGDDEIHLSHLYFETPDEAVSITLGGVAVTANMLGMFD
jgi:hypothetical protein